MIMDLFLNFTGKKSKGKPMISPTRKANRRKSQVQAKVEHIFAVQKDKMGLFIRTIGLRRVSALSGLSN